jgi:hypothetical protein
MATTAAENAAAAGTLATVMLHAGLVGSVLVKNRTILPSVLSCIGV